MPTCARKDIFAPGSEGIFHCWSRCVRLAFLMGKDPETGKDYDHRRQWVLERLEVIGEAFCIDVLFFSLLSNHFHLALATRPRLVQRMGDWEVARRWLLIFPGKRLLTGRAPDPTDDQVRSSHSEIRSRINRLTESNLECVCMSDSFSTGQTFCWK